MNVFDTHYVFAHRSIDMSGKLSILISFFSNFLYNFPLCLLESDCKGIMKSLISIFFLPSAHLCIIISPHLLSFNVSSFSFSSLSSQLKSLRLVTHLVVALCSLRIIFFKCGFHTADAYFDIGFMNYVIIFLTMSSVT